MLEIGQVPPGLNMDYGTDMVANKAINVYSCNCLCYANTMILSRCFTLHKFLVTSWDYTKGKAIPVPGHGGP
jgi:hypothetical protein